ncbi:hypothetical protein Zmor_001800 [Zophobas morio]|uniref:CHK kinase-like domain-containing protein n=1 Tax=Zophobas morio TaxID=2755281 RepID=A0AA38MSP5_9CUCU|nr:hypothetical protein Zmor_001800 [Zophobas morio]
MESEIKSWLNVILKENIKNFSLKNVGNSEKGDGYIGDILFVTLTSVRDKSSPEYNLVLKCSKRSEALRKKTPVKEAFITEIYIYEKVFPTFTHFQLEKGVFHPFKSVPKCHGALIADNLEVIVFDNLKTSGYVLWDKKKLLTRKHIELVVEEYAKFNAVSIAMKDQKPEGFKKLTDNLMNVFQRFVEATDCEIIFGKIIDEIHDLLKDDLDEHILSVWRSLKEKINFIFGDMIQGISGVKVMRHGDCWCNNFMFKHDKKNKSIPTEVAILDWQLSTYSSPVLDLCYFIFANISEEDIYELNVILDYYYDRLKFYTDQLGSELDSLYPREEFFSDWKKYSKYGILMSTLAYKIYATEKNEVLDIVDAVESGNDFGQAFIYEVKNKSALKDRARYIVQYVVANNLISF